MGYQVRTKTLLVTAWSVFAATIISFTAHFVAGDAFTAVNLMLCVVIPISIAVPTAQRVFQQSEDLAEAHAALKFRAAHDPLTGLFNREAFMGRLDEMAVQKMCFALLMIDADHFKRINDSLGHAAGDQALTQIAGALSKDLRDQDFIGRIGGEEFAVILASVAHEADGRFLAESLRRSVEQIPWLIEAGHRGRLTVSIGGTLASPHSKPQDLLREADKQLYEAKRAGRNQVAFSNSPLGASDEVTTRERADLRMVEVRQIASR
jgi:diguanylate cyclase (GGDEF)-like protein